MIEAFTFIGSVAALVYIGLGFPFWDIERVALPGFAGLAVRSCARGQAKRDGPRNTFAGAAWRDLPALRMRDRHYRVAERTYQRTLDREIQRAIKLDTSQQRIDEVRAQQERALEAYRQARKEIQ